MDKAYDADKQIEQLKVQGIIPVLPPKANRKQMHEYDEHIYKERNLVECFIGKLKQFRKIFYASKNGKKIICILFVLWWL